MTALTDPMFHDDDAARAHFEFVLWPNGPMCPHCGVTEGLTRLQGKSHRPGLFQCNACRGHFTVMNGSIMERSHVPLRKWALAFHLMASSKKGRSAHQLHRMLEINYRTAWFMEHRIRECMSGAADTTRWAETARSWKSMRPSSARRKTCRCAAAMPTSTRS